MTRMVRDVHYDDSAQLIARLFQTTQSRMSATQCTERSVRQTSAFWSTGGEAARFADEVSRYGANTSAMLGDVSCEGRLSRALGRLRDVDAQRVGEPAAILLSAGTRDVHDDLAGAERLGRVGRREQDVAVAGKSLIPGRDCLP